eukprot:1152562-Pelagomonas_calceolata.AAC.1
MELEVQVQIFLLKQPRHFVCGKQGHDCMKASTTCPLTCACLWVCTGALHHLLAAVAAAAAAAAAAVEKATKGMRPPRAPPAAVSTAAMAAMEVGAVSREGLKAHSQYHSNDSKRRRWRV